MTAGGREGQEKDRDEAKGAVYSFAEFEQSEGNGKRRLPLAAEDTGEYFAEAEK